MCPGYPELRWGHGGSPTSGLSSTSGVTCEPQLRMSEMKVSSGVAGGLYSSVLHCCEAVAGPVHAVPELDFCRKQTCVLLNTRD